MLHHTSIPHPLFLPKPRALNIYNVRIPKRGSVLTASSRSALIGAVVIAIEVMPRKKSENLEVYGFFFLFLSPKPAKFLEVGMEEYLKELGSLRFSRGSEMVLTSAPCAGSGPKESSRHSAAARLYSQGVAQRGRRQGRHHAPRTFQDRLWPPGHCLPAGLRSPT